MSLGRMYSAQVSAIVVTVVQDLWELNAPSDSIVVIHSARIAQYSDVGDAAAEMLPLQISRSSGTTGSGGTTPTARPHNLGTVAFGGTVEANNKRLRLWRSYRTRSTSVLAGCIVQHRTSGWSSAPAVGS